MSNSSSDAGVGQFNAAKQVAECRRSIRLERNCLVERDPCESHQVLKLRKKLPSTCNHASVPSGLEVFSGSIGTVANSSVGFSGIATGSSAIVSSPVLWGLKWVQK